MPQAIRHDLFARIERCFLPCIPHVKRHASGMLQHDYLVPGGPYEEQWDWDGFFVGMALASRDPAEATWLKNWALNYIENSRDDGFTPGLLTPAGPDWRLKHMKPVLAQGCLHASRFLGDVTWLGESERYARLRRIVLYREEHGLWHPSPGLGAWTDSMESGADNSVALLGYPEGSVAAVDLNTFLVLEYHAMAGLAVLLGEESERIFWEQKAEDIRRAMLKHLWCEEAGAFFNIDTRDGSFIRVIGYGAWHPFWAGIASKEQAHVFFRRHLLERTELRSSYGLRSLSARDPRYNNANIIKPHSNWQGPVWPIATYLGIHALLQYGYQKEAMSLAEDIVRTCLRDIEKTGGMHENYDAETGRALAAPNFISWNLLLMNVFDEVGEGRNPFVITSPNTQFLPVGASEYPG